MKKYLLSLPKNLTYAAYLELINAFDGIYSSSDIETLLIELNDAYRSSEMDDLVSDQLFDALEEFYKNLVPNSKYFDKVGESTKTEPTNRDVKLSYPMGSMTKVHTLREIKKWLGTNSDALLTLTPKYDGLSGLYNELGGGASTRGDGTIGQDCSLHLEHVTSPSEYGIEQDINGTIGEIIISKPNFGKFVESELAKGEDKPSNPRNTVSGFIRHDVPNAENMKLVDFMRFGTTDDNMDKVDQLDACNMLNNVPVPYKVVKLRDLSEEMLYDLYTEWSVDYEIDGIIIEYNDATLRNKLGRDKTTQNPKYAVAYKGDFETRVDVELKDINRNVSKVGNIIPVGEIEPTHMDGVTVTNVTLNNMENVHNYRIYPNEKITMKRSGGVIPKIIAINGHDIPFEYQFETKAEFNKAERELIAIRTKERSRSYEFESCPCCGTHLIWDENHTHNVCSNPTCSDKLFKLIVSFFDTLGVDNFGEPTIKLLVDKGHNTIQSILNLVPSDMEQYDGFGKSKAKTVYDSIHSKLVNVPLSKLMHSSNVFSKAGSKKLRLLNEYNYTQYSDKFEDYSEIDSCVINDILVGTDDNGNEIWNYAEIKGIGTVLLNDYNSNLIKFKEFYDTISDKVSIVYDLPVETPTDGKYVGKNIVITGFRDKELQAQLISEGATIQSSLNKKTDILLWKDGGKPSPKVKKAESMDNVTVIEINSLKL